MDLYVGTSSSDSDFLEAVADHIEAQGVHPAQINLEKGAYRSQLNIECEAHEVAEIATHFASYKSA
ncbi:MAG: hypothetical protein WBC93_01150 [Sulfitobacter sp.]